MKDEIKEILEFKENADYKRLSYSEIKTLLDNIIILEKELDYMVKCDEENQQRIIELGEEINKLTAESTEWESKCYDLQEENKEIKERFDLVCKISEERKNKWLSLNGENDDIVKIIKDYKSRNEKAINDLDILIEIIYQQPTENNEYDMWLLDRLSGIKLELQGEDN